ncbi:uncharacterized protein EHS24_001382 [Apiotrichum porosum]|uniref:Uncharacterized protein n=1 Tax=Apiotrichum porosum TaxID=105984 RepID=A0A427XKE5_9TREE|nr:uncharacterized protein EHS24_001382 [Apiotrichum porosum]RSH79340.1 hypothetical protein EHS24_001382 [Apiotrichum porosum]
MRTSRIVISDQGSVTKLNQAFQLLKEVEGDSQAHKYFKFTHLYLNHAYNVAFANMQSNRISYTRKAEESSASAQNKCNARMWCRRWEGAQKSLGDLLAVISGVNSLYIRVSPANYLRSNDEAVRWEHVEPVVRILVENAKPTNLVSVDVIGSAPTHWDVPTQTCWFRPPTGRQARYAALPLPMGEWTFANEPDTVTSSKFRFFGIVRVYHPSDTLFFEDGTYAESYSFTTHDPTGLQTKVFNIATGSFSQSSQYWIE